MKIVFKMSKILTFQEISNVDCSNFTYYLRAAPFIRIR